jgi:hypothetical protein
MKHRMDSLSEELFRFQGSPASVIVVIVQKAECRTRLTHSPLKQNQHEDL